MFTLAPIWFPHWPACKCKISLMTTSVSRVAATVVIETWFVAVDVVRPRCSRSVCSLHTAADAVRPPANLAGTTVRPATPRLPMALPPQITNELYHWRGWEGVTVGEGENHHTSTHWCARGPTRTTPPTPLPLQKKTEAFFFQAFPEAGTYFTYLLLFCTIFFRTRRVK